MGFIDYIPDMNAVAVFSDAIPHVLQACRLGLFGRPVFQPVRKNGANEEDQRMAFTDDFCIPEPGEGKIDTTVVTFPSNFLDSAVIEGRRRIIKQRLQWFFIRLAILSVFKCIAPKQEAGTRALALNELLSALENHSLACPQRFPQGFQSPPGQGPLISPENSRRFQKSIIGCSRDSFWLMAVRLIVTTMTFSD